jgi:hypothetical protein
MMIVILTSVTYHAKTNDEMKKKEREETIKRRKRMKE